MHRIIIRSAVTPVSYEFYGKVGAHTYNALLSLGVQTIEQFRNCNQEGALQYIRARAGDEGIKELEEFLLSQGINISSRNDLAAAYKSGVISAYIFNRLNAAGGFAALIEDSSYVDVNALGREHQEELEAFAKAYGYPEAHLDYKRGVGAALILK